ncbi:hypothetical protein SISSUDRAFT_1042867 [Sistotremastrum suecicum HHB10207 ss-3]|uniref:Phosphatidylinositol 4-kinase n=1 Tax=Sistotremastrum suecicum HHB10207 ss-3 TaxID=1314776 RepID=A0A166GB60_9AGAM|nr:hypothetical protein SISSUDRAFT_1042867 [Sistotremastrum suecicum HHB10207 ss-3]
MPSRSQYQPLSQQSEEDGDLGDALPQPVTQRNRRTPSLSGRIDLRGLDSAFKRWTENIAQKVKLSRTKKQSDHGIREIARSVFEPVQVQPLPSFGPTKTLDHRNPTSEAEYQTMVQSVKAAISEGNHPKLVAKGSSGSYFAKARVDGKLITVGIFKPKDEEPYGHLNPKTLKWLHRKLRWIIPFGRGCLIPNLSYVSEAAASLLDSRLELNIVPRTELVSLSSPAFFYDWMDRNAAKKGKPLPDKIGSMQMFMHGYQDASQFLRKFPLPDRSISDTYDDATHRTGNFTKRFFNTLSVVCGKTGDDDQQDEEEEDDQHEAMYGFLNGPDENGEQAGRPFYWTQAQQQGFREELEKLVILDYLMRNTDRGADNYMIKACDGNPGKALVDVAPTRSERLQMPLMSELKRGESSTGMNISSSPPSPAFGRPSTSYLNQPHMHIAAIDNSLSFPHEHPRGWRSYTYGWLYLPVSVIGRPFSEKTRRHILPLLTSKAWWEQTTFELRKTFARDPDFHPKMFRRQMAVIKGQAWNIVQCLQHSDEGPLELTRRTKVLIWDDEIEVSEDAVIEQVFNGPLTASPLEPGKDLPGTRLPTRPRAKRSRSIGSDSAIDFPPPIRRTSTDLSSGLPRPVSFASKFPRVHPGASGVQVLEHLERLDVVEAGLQRLGSTQDDVIEEEREDGSQERPDGPSEAQSEDIAEGVVENGGNVEHVEEANGGGPTMDSDLGEVEDAQADLDLAMSLPALPGRTNGRGRWPDPRGRRSFDSWLPGGGESVRKKIVIVERLETVKESKLFPCW